MQRLPTEIEAREILARRPPCPLVPPLTPVGQSLSLLIMKLERELLSRAGDARGPQAESPNSDADPEK